MSGSTYVPTNAREAAAAGPKWLYFRDGQTKQKDVCGVYKVKKYA